MLTLVIPSEIVQALLAALRKAGPREIGGVLMGEHVGTNTFKISEITVHRRGGIASFFRRIEDALGPLRLFFQWTNHDYSRFNYLGEWHSHPLFEPVPSGTDDTSMLQIVQDSSVGANFAVLLIVKLNSQDRLVASAHIYLPNGTRSGSAIKFLAEASDDAPRHVNDLFDCRHSTSKIRRS